MAKSSCRAALLTPALTATAGMILTVAAYYPGALSNDSITMFQQVTIGEWSSVKPPLMRHLWWLVDHVICGSGGMFLVHALIWWAGALLVATACARNAVRRAILVLLVGLLPPAFGMLAALWVDVGMAAFLLLGTGLLLHLGHHRSPLLALAVTSAFFYGGLVRHNAPAAVVPLFFALVPTVWHAFGLARRPGRRLTLGLVVALTLLLLATGQVLDRTGTTNPGKFSGAVGLWDLAAMSVATNEMLIPKVVLADPGHDLGVVRGLFSPGGNSSLYWGDPVLAPFFLRDDQHQALFNAWRAGVRRHPGAYLRHRLRVTLWQLGVTGLPWGTYYFETETRGVTDRCSGFLPNRFRRTRLVLAIERGLDMLTGTPVLRYWPYALISITVLCAALLRPTPRRFTAACLAASGLAYFLPLIVIAPSVEARYTLWSIVAGWIALLIAVSDDPFTGTQPSQASSTIGGTAPAPPETLTGYGIRIQIDRECAQ